jgi:hypothetical protein
MPGGLYRPGLINSPPAATRCRRLSGPGPAVWYRGDRLHGYQQQRDAVSEPLFDAVDRIASFTWDLAEVRALLMALTSVVSDEVELLSSLDAPPRRFAEHSA